MRLLGANIRPADDLAPADQFTGQERAQRLGAAGRHLHPRLGHAGDQGGVIDREEDGEMKALQC